MSEENNAFEGWCVLELFGHRRLGGYVSEQEIAGVAMLRIDVPGKDDKVVATQYYGSSAIYALTPTTEEMAKAVALRNQPRPVSRFELLPMRREPVEEPEFEYEEDDDR